MPKILVIEDMPESAEMTAQILRRYGHQVWIAETADAGLALAAEHSPDLIIATIGWGTRMPALSSAGSARYRH